MKSGMFALAAVVFFAGFLIIGSMLMLGAVGSLDTEDVPTEFNGTADMMQGFFSVFQEWNTVLIWFVAVVAIIIGLWWLLRIKK